jgi:hypothetical protein
MQTVRSLALILWLSAPLRLWAQDATPWQEAPRPADAALRNAVYIEFGGNALIYSMNAERLISTHVSIRGGLMLLPDLFSGQGGLVKAAPLSVNGLFGKDGHYFEAGAGIVLGVGAISGAEIDFVSGASATITLGYRRVRGRRIMRVGFTPVFQTREHSPLALNLDGKPYTFPGTGGRPWRTSFGFSVGRTF